MSLEESLIRVLSSLIEATEELCAYVEKNELSHLSALVDARGAILAEYGEIVNTWKDLERNADNNSRALEPIGPLVEQLKQVDLKFVTLTQAKQEKAANKVKQLQNQKLLLAYSV